jgi:hypothetical protein
MYLGLAFRLLDTHITHSDRDGHDKFDCSYNDPAHGCKGFDRARVA